MPVDPANEPVAAVRAIEQELGNYSDDLADKPRWLVINKVDLVPDAEREAVCAGLLEELGWEGPAYRVSAATGEGTEALAQAVMRALEAAAEEAADASE